MLQEDTQGLAAHYEAKFVWQALSDYKSYVLSAIQLGILIPGFAISIFLPTIINSLGKQGVMLGYMGPTSCAGYSPAISQLLSIPPYAIACASAIPGRSTMSYHG